MRSRSFILVLVLVMFGASSALAQATFTVTTTNDSGPGSLRQAILDANENPGADQIHFDIPGNGPHTIRPADRLPRLEDPVTIDALTQPGADCSTWPATLLIEIDGSAQSGSGLDVFASNVTIRGLVINRANDAGIRVSGFVNGGEDLMVDNTVIECNYIGTDVTGTLGLGNDDDGIFVFVATNTRIGGTGPAQRNLISGNGEDGIELRQGSDTIVQGNVIGTDATGAATLPNDESGIHFGFESSGVAGGTDHDPGVCNRACNLVSGNEEIGVRISGLFNGSVITDVTVQGNFIGTDITGTIDLGNSEDGVILSAAESNQIGGAAPGAGNLIAGNGQSGMDLISASGNQIEGNLIGTDVSGASALGNGEDGITFRGSSSYNSVGGTMPGAGNVIAYNGRDGLQLRRPNETTSTLGNAILGNAIYANSGLGINLCVADFPCDATTANDLDDDDPGPNRLQNYPELASATGDGVALTVAYVVPTATANAAYPLRVEFFLADADDEEGQTFIGSDSYTNGDAQKTKQAQFQPASPVNDGTRIVATATDADGNTSEFSASIEVTASANRPPTAQDDTATTTEDTPVEINVLSNDTDPDGDNLTVTVTASPANGTAEVLADQRIRYTPADDFTGEDVFTYQVDDGRGGTDEATVTITVNASNAAPTAPEITSPADGAEVFIGGAPGEDPLDPEATLMVAWAESTDPDGDDLTYTWQLAATEDFANLLFSADTGTATQFETTLGDLAALLDAAGVELGGSVSLYHRAVASDGQAETAGPTAVVTLVRGTLTEIEDENDLPEAFALEANYPNPFNPQTTIGFALPQSAQVRLVVYDGLGREVARLVGGTLSAGWHEVVFDAAGLPTGVYLYRLQADGFVQTRRMLLVK